MNRLEQKILAEQYYLRKLAGEGGMGQVYQAWDRKRSTYVAVKTISEERFVKSFITEIEALIKLSHPNIIRVYGAGLDNNAGVAYIVTEWIDGKDLSGVLKKRKYLGVGEVVHIFECVQKALHYIHYEGVCHCDIKPGNILLRNADNLAILGDFGLAHATHEQSGGGTPHFMAPELFNPNEKYRKYSVASDIYALGVTLYQLLSGNLPFSGNTWERLIQEHRYKTPVSLQRFNPSISGGIVSVIEKSLAKDPRRRYQSVTEMFVDFSKYAGGEKRKDVPTYASYLCRIKGEKVHYRIRVSGDLTIGRSKKNQLRLEHPSVSRYHAVIIWQQGRFFIRDNGSSVGTYLNGHRLKSNKKEKLRHGDKIKIGVSDMFEFREK